MKKIFLLLFALFANLNLVHAGVVNGTCGNNLTWSLDSNNGVLTIEGSGPMYNWSRYTGNTVPWYEYRSYIKHVSVLDGPTSIGEAAFCDYYCNIISVTIGNSIENIEKDAFMYCQNLKSISLSENLMTIGDDAFYGCSSLTSITIPSRVTNIGVLAFYECSNLNSVYINDLSAWCNISFKSNGNPLTAAHHLYLHNTEIKNLIIPSDVTSIADEAFCGCYGLTSISIPNSVLSIGKDAFSFCKNITAIEIPNGVANIKDGAFRYCNNLSSVTIGNSVTNIGSYAFQECPNLSSIEIGNNIGSIGQNAFSNSPIISLTILATTPPQGGAISGINNSSCTLYVPIGSLSTYSNAIWWEDFFAIEGIEVPEHIENTIVNIRQNTKTIRDGHVMIQKGDKVYTLQGVEVK